VSLQLSNANYETSYGYRGPQLRKHGNEQSNLLVGKEASKYTAVTDCTFGRLCVGPSTSTTLDGGRGDDGSPNRQRILKTATTPDTRSIKLYPIYPGTSFQSTFEVPPLPEYFDTESMTYYDYFNIYFDGAYQPKGGKFNQFVPQLMLGNALAQSTGPPKYDPIWVQLDSWHFGAQYFMGIYKNQSYNVDNPTASLKNATSTTTDEIARPLSLNSKSLRRRDATRINHRHTANQLAEKATGGKPWISKAAVGALHPVYPGELLETKISLSRDGMIWKLEMKVMGDTRRVSTLLVDKPFMGLLDNADNDKETNNQDDNKNNNHNDGTTGTPYSSTSSSWKEYKAAAIGSCWENYGMLNETSYPPFWHQIHTIRYPMNIPLDDNIWGEWITDSHAGGNCSKIPRSTVRSFTISETSMQVAVWDIEQSYRYKNTT